MSIPSYYHGSNDAQGRKSEDRVFIDPPKRPVSWAFEFCALCDRKVERPCRYASPSLNEEVIYVASHWELRRLAYFRRLKRAAGLRLHRALDGKGMPQRKVVDWVTLTIPEFGGRILDDDGSPYCTPDGYIEAQLCSDDSARWISEVKSTAYRKVTQRPQRKTLPRWQLIDLALRIEAKCGQRWYPERQR